MMLSVSSGGDGQHYGNPNNRGGLVGGSDARTYGR
jgi:hypothetical protein